MDTETKKELISGTILLVLIAIGLIANVAVA
jgi:hypothetical protein